MSLLPSNSTTLERLAAQALAQLEQTPVPLRELWNPDTCPVAFLPYLAWAFSVDRWSPAWPESAKRGAIRAAYNIHARKGTISALRRVVEPLGYLIEVNEWWEQNPPGTPGTFELLIGVLDTGITDQMYDELVWLIDDAKPLSRHISGLAISLDISGTEHIGIALTTGDELDIFPPQARTLEISGMLAFAAREHVIDTMEIHHNG